MVLHKMNKKPLFVIIPIFVIGIIIFYFSSCKNVMWDGGFPTAEFILRFENDEGRQIKGLSLQILDNKGNLSYQYPIREFVATAPLNSDYQGIFTLHQAHSGIQFGGTYDDYFGFFKIGNWKAPQYEIKVFKDGVNLHTLSFNDLYKGIDYSKLKVVKRKFGFDEFRALDDKNYSKDKIDPEKTKETDFFVIERIFKIKK